MKADFNDFKRTLDELVEKHSDKIKDNESFMQLLNKLSKNNDKKNEIIKELVKSITLMHEQIQRSFEYSRINNTRLSALETAVSHIEKSNEKWLELINSVQEQIDTLVEE